MTTDSGECLTCATDTSPGGIVWTRTTVLIDTLRRLATDDELAVLVEASDITTAAVDGMQP